MHEALGTQSIKPNLRTSRSQHLVATLFRLAAFSLRGAVAAIPVVFFALAAAGSLRLQLGHVPLLHLDEEADHRRVAQVVLLFRRFLSGVKTEEKQNVQFHQIETRGSGLLHIDARGGHV